ncbi:Bug family tripartite tricarboxylate transporter substrate binding protein [Bordetella genomosp. 13]|uniref:Bug family tripartite tricarboxylate transporter substrate binding protein n=1 Tax=Bordetella genomosp. 13 TaxID=463040 RepID=UPI0011A10E0A|nr:tripartite tricarboxylate transporter substrate binding protein [Bordetella genomosp. 13]
MQILRLAAAAAAAVALMLSGTSAWAYPDKPIRLIVPFPPGGGTDALARQIAIKMGADTGWNIVTENRPGAGGNLGVDLAAKAAPDGHTIALGQTSNLAINPTLYPKLPYDPERDLTPIGLVADAPLVLVVNAGSPFKTLADVVAAAKAKPTELDYASSGSGTVAHLATEQFQKAAGIKLTHIPYKGAAQGANDLIGGQIDMYMSSVPTLIGHIRSGTMRALAVTSTQRTADLPDVPTFAESGFKGFEAVTWFGLVGPAKMPADVVAQLNKALNDALKSPETQRHFQEQGAAVRSSTPQAYGQLIHDERARWGAIVREAGVRVD